jgi:hypothetical protein
MISEFIPNKSYAIVAGYCDDGMIAALGGVLYRDKMIEIIFPKVNPFEVGQKITFHLDNRTGLEEFDINLRVYRVSVKAKVVQKRDNAILAEPVEYELKYSNKTVDSYIQSDYSFPRDNRVPIKLAEATISPSITFDDKEKENKLGILITKAIDRPHTTVMAFLSSTKDDIFIISHVDSFKSRNIQRDENCIFAIDHRGVFVFEKAIDWNYTLIKGKLNTISKSNPMFSVIQSKFIEKNPWEYAFFTDEKVEMYQIEPREIMCPERLRK